MRTPFDHIFDVDAAPLEDVVRPPFTPVDEGMYSRDGNVYRVVRSAQGHLYAKCLDPDRKCYEYAPGVIKALRPEHRMTLEQGKEYSAKLGVCCVCARTLSNKDSVAAGIGPICATKF